jgi:AcrR family transcriptional regulator
MLLLRRTGCPEKVECPLDLAPHVPLLTPCGRTLRLDHAVEPSGQEDMAGMVRNRFENLEPERREAMLAAAGLEFAERGYAGASLNRIIEAAGLSKGSLYYYFEDKEDLFVTTVEVALGRLMEGVGGFDPKVLSADDYWEALRALSIRSLEMMGREDWYVRLAGAFPRLRSEPEARDAVRPSLEWGRRFLRDLLGHGQELGEVRRDLPLDMLVEVTLAMDEAGDRWLMENMKEFDETGLKAHVEARLDMMRDMLDAKHEGWDR